MEDRRSVIISAIIGILVLALIIGVIIYLIRFILNRPSNPGQTPEPEPTIEESTQPNPSKTPRSSASPRPSGTATPNTGLTVYKGEGFEISYPRNWGILTCSNSQNIEFDPNSSQDQLKVYCDVAQKPITVLVNSNTCSGGENGSKGGINFVKTKKQTAQFLSYKWCLKTTPALEVSHRVSDSGGRATSKQDFSAQIEELISRIKF